MSIIPLEVVTRNVIAGSLSKRLGMEEGTVLAEPIVEFYFKDDDLGDPLVTEDHIRVLNVASPEQVSVLRDMALQINQVLIDHFASCRVRLVDFKLEFGVTEEGEIILADEISPDTCRLWDETSNEKFDKDVFRRDLGNLTEAYEEILKRLGEFHMYKVKVYVTLRESVLDPQGTAVKGALHSLSFTEVQDVRIGKYMELTIDKSVSDLDSKVKEMCENY